MHSSDTNRGKEKHSKQQGAAGKRMHAQRPSSCKARKSPMLKGKNVPNAARQEYLQCCKARVSPMLGPKILQQLAAPGAVLPLPCQNLTAC